MRIGFLITATLGLVIFIDSALGGFFLRLPFEITFVLAIIGTWILPAFLLAKIPGGLRIYFINLTLSLLICGGYYMIAAPLSGGPTDWRANLAGIEMMILALMIWITWGWILLFYAGLKRFR